MPYYIAGIDVHKKMLAIVVADVEVAGEYQFERLKAGTSPTQLHVLADWLAEHEVEEVVMDRPRSIGDRSGRPWSGTGDRNVGRAPMRALSPARYTLRKRNRIGALADASETFPTRSVW
jgi:hypothetical protein